MTAQTKVCICNKLYTAHHPALHTIKDIGVIQTHHKHTNHPNPDLESPKTKKALVV